MMIYCNTFLVSVCIHSGRPSLLDYEQSLFFQLSPLHEQKKNCALRKLGARGAWEKRDFPAHLLLPVFE